AQTDFYAVDLRRTKFDGANVNRLAETLAPSNFVRRSLDQQLHARRSLANSGPFGRQIGRVHHFQPGLRLVIALVDLLSIKAHACLALLAQIARLDQYRLAAAVGIGALAALMNEFAADLLLALLHRDILAVEVPGPE